MNGPSQDPRAFRGRVRRAGWLRLAPLGLALFGAGCTLTPQADVADFFFRSRNACLPPPSERGEPPVAGATLVPSAPLLPPGQNVIIPAAPQTGPAPADATLPAPPREGHPWFRIFRRNRN